MLHKFVLHNDQIQESTALSLAPGQVGLLSGWGVFSTLRIADGVAEDLVQEVFLSAMEQLRGLRTAAAFGGWLAAIARHRAMDHFRRTRQTAPLELVDPALPRAAVQDAFLVLRQIRGLPEAYRETLILRLVEGMTGPEIAAHTGLTPDSVRVNLCRGMKMLRALLEAK